ncbi:MAG: TetR/AcrR family transcriptional regulator [Candidatus Binatia bacterium]
MNAAVEAFTEAGFENTTVSDVVHRAGMTPSTFYNYYRDKDALRDELVAAAAGRMIRALAEIRTKSSGAEDYFRASSRRLFAAVVADPSISTLLRRNLPHLRSLLDDKALKPVYAAIRTDIETFATRGMMDPIDAEYAGAVLRASAVEIAVVLLSRPEADVEAAVEFLTRVLGAAFRFR